VAAATGYQWESVGLVPYLYVDGAENGLTNVTAQISGGYSLITTDAKAAGTYSYHLAHVASVSTQYLTLTPSLLIRTNSQLSFAKRLGYATGDETARVQVSSDGGSTWQSIWSQAGSNGSGDSSFTRMTNSLSTYSNKVIQVRFSYEFPSGSYYNSAASGVGLYLDDLAVSSCDQLAAPALNTVTNGTSFAYTPANTNDALLMVRAKINTRTLSWGPVLRVSVSSAPQIQIISKPVIAAGQAQIDFTVASFTPGMTFQLWKAPDPNGPWTQDNTATITTLIANSKFRATTSIGTAARGFYKIRGL
jgi:hypothetical protein